MNYLSLSIHARINRKAALAANELSNVIIAFALWENHGNYGVFYSFPLR